MADPRTSLSRYLTEENESDLHFLLEQGIFKPLFLYHVISFNVLPWIALLIPKRQGGQYIRRLVFTLNLACGIEALRNNRALLGGNGYMIGMLVAWWLIWSATLFVFSDVERDFQRIERTTVDIDGPSSKSGKEISPREDTKGSDTANHEQFYWQAYPSKFTHRVEWCAGLLFNLRGPEWNWRAPRLGPVPKTVHEQLKSGFLSKHHSVEGGASCITAKARLQEAFRTCLTSYLILDALKVIMMRDPYFRGTVEVGAIPPFPFSFLASIPFAVRFYRCFFSCMGIYVALNFVTSFNPICFLGLSLAFPSASRKLTGAPLDAPWLYANSFGPFFSPTLDHGLAGAWGQWWHQLFRYGFTATARWVLSLLPSSWGTNSGVKRVTYIVIAFALSGFVHACGSYTQFKGTRPLTGPFSFFFLQSLAIIVEYTFKAVVIPKLPVSNMPRWLGRTTNATIVFFWLLLSGGLIADDFARGGLWLMEPVPFSPLRGLGLANGQGWWCWQGTWFAHWSDGTYWGSGIRVI
ncbi:hypothetical protein N7456_011459 [Penicillium angulare]|uniref:Wax synthase domain-containing protein n=1 Tax=Penicillium angulare TaxID=116970 RepID=A0A9W9ETP3_9EURO|nr:hypothetical protein N7456_011459 [Penicillium angulare]